MKYDVHLFYAVRIKVEGVDADSQEAAILKAEMDLDVGESLRCGAFENDEAPHLGALVDECEDEGFLNTRYHEGPGARLYLGDEHQGILDNATP